MCFVIISGPKDKHFVIWLAESCMAFADASGHGVSSIQN